MNLEGQQAEEIVEAAATHVEESSESTTEDQVWGDSTEDSFKEDAEESELLTEEEGEAEEEQENISEEVAEAAPAVKKNKVQERFDRITQEKREIATRLAHSETTNKFLMQQLNQQKQAVQQQPVVPTTLEEPKFEEFEKKYEDDPDKANREYLKAHNAFTLKSMLEKQKTQAATEAESKRRVTTSAAFVEGSYKLDPEKYPNFHQIVFDPRVTMNDALTDLVESSPQKYDLAFRIASDNELREKLNSLPTAHAAKEIGNLEAIYATPPNKRFKSKAPKGIKGVGNRNKATAPTEEDMDIDTFLKMEDEKLRQSGGW
jgi:hypothetical protein